MKIIKHKFKDHQIGKETEILIIGTFNPDTPDNAADFFYGRSKNYLWKLIPTAFKEKTLKGESTISKKEFLLKYKIDFIDLIEEVKGEVNDFKDVTLDNKEIKWKNIIMEIDTLPNLKRVCFTRKTFSKIPNMKFKTEEIQNHLKNKYRINLVFLTTPARFYNKDKQVEWNLFFNPHT